MCIGPARIAATLDASVMGAGDDGGSDDSDAGTTEDGDAG